MSSRARLTSFLSSTASSSLHSILNYASNPSESLAMVVRENREEEEESDSEEEISENQVDDISISTNCTNCGTRVTVTLPPWISNAISAEPRTKETFEENEFRDSFVSGAVGIAVAIKESSIPSMIINGLKWVFVASLYLDATFSLHQKFAVLIGAILEAFLEIEKEVGLFRNLGSTISVVWEAAVKSTIAFAKSKNDSSPPKSEERLRKRSTTQDKAYPPKSRQSSATTPRKPNLSSTPAMSAHARSHHHNESSGTGKVKVRYERDTATTTQELNSKSHLHPTLRRATRSTSSLNSSKSTSNVVFPTSILEPPTYSPSYSTTPDSTRRRRSRSATGGSLEKEQEKDREAEKERERVVSSTTWTGSLRALGSLSSVGRSFGRA